MKIDLGWLAVGVLAFAACKEPGADVDPKIRADGHYLAGQAAFLKGDFAEAHKQFAEVKKLGADPRLAAAEGEVYLSEANIGEALRCFEEATKADPKRGTNWSRLGYLYGLKNEPEKAKDALDKALALNPKDFNALESMADLQVKTGKVKEAVANLLLASEAAPDGLKAELVLKATGELTKAKLQADALPILEDAVKKGVKNAEIFTELGDRRVEANKLGEAVEAYTEAAKANAKDPTLWELVGELHVKLGDLVRAEESFKKSLAVKDRCVVHVALARMCLAKKDDACVKAELDKALNTASGEELRETTDLADLLVSLNRKKDALTLVRTVSEEPEQKANVDLQLKVARLAKELKDEVTVKAACTRALSSGEAGLRCP